MLLAASAALAQVELVDPDAPAFRPAPKKPNPIEAVDPKVEPEDETPTPTNVGTVRAPSNTPDAGGSATPTPSGPAPVAEPERPPLPRLEVREISDAVLDLAWNVWREANQKRSTDLKSEQVARQRLLELKEEIGASNMDTWAMGLLRAAEAHEVAGDSGSAVELARSATLLAPDLPSTWVGLSAIYFRGDPTNLGRFLGSFKNALVASALDPRSRRSASADLTTTLLFALVITTIVLLSVLAVRRGYYALYDFHFIFPRVASRWQTGALAAVLLILPVVFRLGLVPVLLTVFFALALYLSRAERVVVAVLIAVLGIVPSVGAFAVDHFAFAGTRAEQLFHLERGATGLEPLAAELTQLASEDKASYAELMALGRYDLRRGRAEAASKSFKKALYITPNDPAARVNLGMSMVIIGDLENPRGLFEEAAKQAPSLAQAPYNLGRLYQRRVALYGDKVSGEFDKIAEALFAARVIDPTFAALSKDPEGTPRSLLGNVYLQSVPMPEHDLLVDARAPEMARRVRSQLLQILMGEVNEAFAMVYPGLLALLVLGFGFLSETIQAARSCSKCGRPVSKRGDPDLSVGSQMCTQCVNAFVKKNVVAPSLKVLKQLEVVRYQSRMERTVSIMGFLCSGMGHVCAGFPARGTFYAFLFISLLTALVLRSGVVRPPFDPLPLAMRLVPVGVALVVLYVLTLRGLRKKQGG